MALHEGDSKGIKTAGANVAAVADRGFSMIAASERGDFTPHAIDDRVSKVNHRQSFSRKRESRGRRADRVRFPCADFAPTVVDNHDGHAVAHWIPAFAGMTFFPGHDADWTNCAVQRGSKNLISDGFVKDKYI